MAMRQLRGMSDRLEKQRTADAAPAAPPPQDAMTKERSEIAGQLPRYQQAGERYAGRFRDTGKKYLKNVGAQETAYQGQMSGLMREAEDMGKLATQTYGDVSSRQKGIMDRAGTEASGAMTLAESQDPNNPVAQRFRQFYEQQAQGSRQAGMADVGVMQALGAQALGGQMGGAGPMTGGQMAAMMGQTQSQAGQAMANVQRRVQDLRDQGIAQGWSQTDKAYGRGQEARDYYGQATRDYGDTQDRFQGLMGGLRGERGMYGENILGSRGRAAGAERDFGMDYAGLRHGLSTGDLDRQTAMITSEYDRRSADRMSSREAEAARYAADRAKQGAIYGGLLGAGGSALGGFLGGLG